MGLFRITCSASAGRIIHYKVILKRYLIPAQGDPENRTGGAGVRERLNADRDAERRGPDGATDHRVFEGKRRNRIYRRGPGIDLRMDGAIAGRAGVCGQGEEGAGREPQVCVQGYVAEPSANDKADPELPGDGNSGGEAEPETTIPGASTQKGMCACWQRWTRRTSG